MIQSFYTMTLNCMAFLFYFWIDYLQFLSSLQYGIAFASVVVVDIFLCSFYLFSLSLYFPGWYLQSLLFYRWNMPNLCIKTKFPQYFFLLISSIQRKRLEKCKKLVFSLVLFCPTFKKRKKTVPFKSILWKLMKYSADVILNFVSEQIDRVYGFWLERTTFSFINLKQKLFFWQNKWFFPSVDVFSLLQTLFRF